MIKKQLNQDISIQLKADYNFIWLSRFGQVFAVFDQQDSGNISFGVESEGVKRFLKYAGAETLHGSVSPELAVQNLKQSVGIYQDLSHASLVNLLDHMEVGDGYCLLFDWFGGEVLHNHWNFPPPLKYEHPDSPFFRFKQLPIEKRLAAFKQILEFHVHVERHGYVAIDFYDGSILYDFTNYQLKICDIDLYRKKPYINTMGRMWGSSRFMSPEEFELGAVIDGSTNVFNMGAMAFSLLGGELNRSYDKWEAGRELYEVAIKAVEKDRNKRFPSVEVFYQEWNKSDS
ncbi:serine/threonine-protein kinase [Ornithinibacillus sp. FSL M8-0202]|uniref:serine/threonine-protein kinase n=1 Tax=Ornithinibacillus sp. FSL M8-0202 TaxID=2921616 RepID=UPI0030D05858